MTAPLSFSGFAIRPGQPGARRSQLIDPRPGIIDAAIEDDFHHFRVTIHHDGATVRDIVTAAVRWPWTTCPSAGIHLAQRMTGVSLSELAEVDPPQAHCTHMHELALLSASHAHDDAPVLYSSFVSDPVAGEPRRGEVWINGEEALVWLFEGSLIVSDGPMAGRDLRHYRHWESMVPPEQRRAAKVLRRMVQISDGRKFDHRQKITADQMPGSAAACYTFQPVRSSEAHLKMQERDFTNGPAPLAEQIAHVMDRVRH